MPFSDFHGNETTVRQIREMLARDHFPHSVILAGPAGSGKYTLSTMIARAMNCLEKPITDGLPDFCGKCSNCVRIGQSEDLESRCSEASEAREALKETEKKETRLFIQTHPDVLVIPPDPPQMMIKVDQVRRVIESIYFRPAEARERVFIFTDSAFMKEAANSLLKVLEEPPEFATIFLLAESSGELLPTIRSRCMTVQLKCLSLQEIENYLARHRPEWKPQQRSLVARLSEGAVGRARNFNLDTYVAARGDALTILRTALRASDHSELFKVTETYRAGAEGREKIELLLRCLYSLLQDLLFIEGKSPGQVRNTDVMGELQKFAEQTNFDWLSSAAERLGEVERGLRRNLLRSLSLDSFEAALERPA
ncbi:MAG TPA: DNA polymerase III subunit delta' [Terriglobales bacterium]|nr:DNA polymerase III subunit delta' [Terriglobales bacterium]